MTQLERGDAVGTASSRRRGVDLLVVAVVFAAAVVVGARLWFSTLQAVWPTDDPLRVGLQFGSFLLVLGGVLAALWREEVGLGVGRTFAQWRLVLLWAAVLSAVTGLYVTLSEANPYSSADPLFEMVLVPLGEELVFRGLLLSWLLSRLGRRVTAPTATRLAVGYSAVAFGAAHASNALFGVGGFALR
jgi:membrane protease YdiL (CAAX protease family)